MTKMAEPERRARRSMLQTVDSLTDAQRAEVESSLEGWHDLFELRESLRQSEIGLSSTLSDPGSEVLWRQKKRLWRRVRLEARALDAAYLLHGTDGPRKVRDAMRRFIDSEDALADHSYLQSVLAQMKEERLGFDELAEADRLHTAAMIELPIEPSSTDADTAGLWARAQGIAQQILDGETVQTALREKGPAEAAIEALGLLTCSEANSIRESLGFALEGPYREEPRQLLLPRVPLP